MIKVTIEPESENNGYAFEFFYDSNDNTLRIFDRADDQMVNFFSVVDYDEFIKALKFAKDNG